jgi:hypothetical protein
MLLSSLSFGSPNAVSGSVAIKRKGTIIMAMHDKLSELCRGERQGIPLNVVVLVGAVLFCCVASELALAIK